jgi:uncharacterized membrane protein
MHRRIGDLAIIASLVLVAVLITRLGVTNIVLRTAVALPLLFFLPGYAVTVALFPRNLPEIPERFLISVGMSLALALLGGLLLNLTRWGLRAESWSLWLGGVTLAACLTALLRRPRQLLSTGPRVNLAIRFDRWMFILLVALGVVVAMGIATSSALQQKPSSFTQLWILPGDGENSGTVRLGVNNMELELMSYKLELEQDGSVLRRWPSITLAPGEIWETHVSALAGESITATLYRLDAPSVVYRQVTLRQGK